MEFLSSVESQNLDSGFQSILLGDGGGTVAAVAGDMKIAVPLLTVTAAVFVQNNYTINQLGADIVPAVRSVANAPSAVLEIVDISALL